MPAKMNINKTKETSTTGGNKKKNGWDNKIGIVYKFAERDTFIAHTKINCTFENSMAVYMKRIGFDHKRRALMSLCWIYDHNRIYAETSIAAVVKEEREEYKIEVEVMKYNESG